MKITPEIQEQINILYLKLKVKSAVAKEIGCSPATVSKYIIPNFVPPEDRETYTFDGEIGNSNSLIKELKKSDNVALRICELCLLSEEEKADLKKLQKEVYV